MDLTTRAAIEKAATDKTIKGATAELDAGTHRIDVTVRVHGTITKGEDYEQTFWNSLPLLGMMLRAMNSAGIVLGKGQVKRMVADVLANDLTTAELLAEKELKAWVKELQTEMATACTKVATGKTTASLAVETVAETAEPFAVETETAAPVAS